MAAKRSNTSFIQSLSSNTTLSDLEKQTEKIPTADIEQNNQVIKDQEEEKEVKKKSKDDLSFLKEILRPLDNKNDKGYVYISGKSHNRLKTLSSLIDAPISEITDSIINDFFEKNKDQINTMIKKNQANLLF